MLCVSAVETAKDMFGNMASGRFPRCCVFASRAVDKAELVMQHSKVCQAIKRAGEIENGDYKEKWDYETFVKSITETIPNIGKFSGQHWLQVLITLGLLQRPQWSEEAFVTKTTVNYDRFMRRFNLSNAETVKSVFESVSLSTRYSRFLVENMYCEMYKDYVGGGNRASQARDCFHLGSRMYRINCAPYTDDYKTTYLVYGEENDAIEISKNWWEEYEKGNTKPQSKRENPHLYGQAMKKAYAKWRNILEHKGRLDFSGADGTGKLFIGFKKDVRKPPPTLLDVTVEFQDIAGARGTDHMANTRWLLRDFEGFRGNGIAANLSHLSRAGKKVCVQDSYQKTPPTEAQFQLPPKRSFEDVMGLLIAESGDWEAPPKTAIGQPCFPLASFKPACNLRQRDWLACEWKM
jgi:hypothetical protein